MPTHATFSQLFDDVRRAWYSSRSVVPIIGAGLSVDSGIPIIRTIVRYLGMLQKYLEMRAFLPRDSGDLLTDCGAYYTDQPWRYISEFRWPDPFQLQQDLLGKAEEECPLEVPAEVIGRWACEGLESALGRTNPAGCRHYEDFRTALKNVPGLTDEQKGAIEESLGPSGGYSVAFNLLGDWKRLLQHFTKFRGDYADALFSRLCAGKGPSLGHRYLAFLANLLAVKTVFTFNFDDLIEQSLEELGVRPKVFAMEEGRSLPHASLTGEGVSVIKMHGSSHALLVDERLDHPLSDEYKQRFGAIVRDAPLLLVVGCSGDDNRLRTLVEYVLRTAKSGAERAVIWLHFEKAPPPFLGAYPGKVLAVPTNSPGATMQHLYSALTGRHPASPVPYLSHIQRPILRASSPAPARVPGSPPFCFSTLGAPKEPTKYPRRSASQALFEEATGWMRSGYQVVWIDLEECHTLASVVGSIIDQCRRGDATLTPSVLPLFDEGDSASKVAVERVAHALRRGRYFVAFDGLETYVWPPTSHHGETTLSGVGAALRLGRLCSFLKGLWKEKLGESRLALSVDRMKPRNQEHGTPGATVIEEFVRERKPLGGGGDVVELAHGTRQFDDVVTSLPEGKAPLQTLSEKMLAKARDASKAYLLAGGSQEAWALILLYLASFRRSRTFVALHAMLTPLTSRRVPVESVLDALDPAGEENPLGLIRLEGGGCWFNRTVRDELYNRNSEYASDEKIGSMLLAGNAPWAEEAIKAVAQLLLLSTTHQRIARVYYTDTFGQSKDCQSFLEYTYHRLSSIRYLTRLLAITRAAAGILRKEDAVRQGFERCGELFQRASESRNGLLRSMEIRKDEAVWKAITGPLEDRPAFTDIVANLEERHERELQGLFRSWVRSEPLLRVQLPAEQLLRWCESLLDDDLKYRCDHVVVGYTPDAAGPANTVTPKVYPEGDGGVGSLTARGTIRSFSAALEDLVAKLLIERSDFDSCIKRREALLAGINPPYRARHLHYLLDIAVCRIKLHQEEGRPVDLDAVRLNVVERELTETVEPFSRRAFEQGGGNLGPYPPDEFTTLAGDAHEARLRLHHLRCETRLRDVSVFSRQFLGHKCPDGIDLDGAEFDIAEGLSRTRFQDVRAGGAPRSIVLDPTTDGSLYNQYRSVFHMLRGRAAWLRFFPVGQHVEAELLPALEDRFAEGFENFELARGGLCGTNPLLTGLIELYAVEACLARSRIRLHHELAETHKWQPRVVVEEAVAKYEMARFALRRARAQLPMSRRNAIWWKLFYLFVAQYHADRLALGCARLLGWSEPGQWPPSPLGSAELPQPYLHRLRRAYGAVINAQACNAPASKSAEMSDTWLPRVWRELTVTAYAVARTFLYLKARSNPSTSAAKLVEDEKGRESALALVPWLNKRYGLDSAPFAAGRDGWLKDRARDLDTKLSDHFTRAADQRPLEALRLRLDLLR